MSLRTFVAGLGLTLGLLGGSALANTVGTVSSQRLLSDTPAGKRASAAFDLARKTKQGLLDKQQEDLRKQAAELDKDAPKLKPEILAAKRWELQKQGLELQQRYVQFERELAADRAKLVANLMQQADPIIQELAKAGGIDLVVDSSVVVWSAPGVDLTDKVSARLK